jgi:trans-aconitate methyltransferase
MTLCELAVKYGTDKHPWYTPTYEMLLGSQRFKVRKVLEIGIGNLSQMSHVHGYQPGASLRMWRDYFPGAQIFGLDIDPQVMIQDARIETRVCDQSNAEALKHIGEEWGKFDLIVDDGSHDPQHQLLSFETLWPYLREGGYYIIEDVNRPEALLLPQPSTVLLCRIPESDLVGRAVVVKKS